MRNSFQLLLPVVLGLVIAGCGSGSGGGGAIAVDPVVPPAGLSYLVVNAVYVVDEAVPVNVPSLAEGEADTFSIAPALPDGLNFNDETGAIAGTPTTAQSLASYIITATNDGGSTNTKITITIQKPDPSYATASALYFVGIAILPNVVENPADTATYSVDPALPGGLALDAASGTISGTPDAAASLATYSVTESSADGDKVIELDIQVAVDGPSDLSYDTPVTVFELFPMDALAPAVSGSPVETYSVDPALPAGISLDANTGIISGTADSAVAAQDYVIRAENAGGFAEFTLNLTVEAVTICDMSYADSGVSVLPSEELPELAPTIDCTLDNFTISPDLPEGISMDEATGIISGSCDFVTETVVYTVSATGAGGFMASADVEITVACDLGYDSPVVLIPGAVAPENAPLSGCDLDDFTVTPDLPDGLTIDAATGIISGTPSEATPAATYTISATGAEGISASAVVIITAGPIFQYGIVDSRVSYDEGGSASFSVDVTLEEHPDNPNFPNDMAGFQMGLGHDNSILDATSVNEGPDLSALNGGTGPDFFLWSIHPDGITLGVVVALDLSDMIVADGEQVVATIDYDADVDTIVFPDGVTTTLQWRQDLGSPPVANLVSVQDDLGGFGVSENAVVTDGEVELVPSLD